VSPVSYQLGLHIPEDILQAFVFEFAEIEVDFLTDFVP
jgi:hypothetical protein